MRLSSSIHPELLGVQELSIRHLSQQSGPCSIYRPWHILLEVGLPKVLIMGKAKDNRPAKKIPAPPGPEASWEEQSAYFEKYGMEELEEAGYMHDLSGAEKDELEELSELARKRLEARKARRN